MIAAGLASSAASQCQIVPVNFCIDPKSRAKDEELSVDSPLSLARSAWRLLRNGCAGLEQRRASAAPRYISMQVARKRLYREIYGDERCASAADWKSGLLLVQGR